jgi:hypothetical protein
LPIIPVVRQGFGSPAPAAADHMTGPLIIRVFFQVGLRIGNRVPAEPHIPLKPGDGILKVVQMTLYLKVSQWRPLQQDLPFKRKSQRLIDDPPHHGGIVLSFLDFSLQKPIIIGHVDRCDKLSPCDGDHNVQGRKVPTDASIPLTWG